MDCTVSGAFCYGTGQVTTVTSTGFAVFGELPDGAWMVFLAIGVGGYYGGRAAGIGGLWWMVVSACVLCLGKIAVSIHSSLGGWILLFGAGCFALSLRTLRQFCPDDAGSSPAPMPGNRQEKT